jgi:predicted N-formylglutamate amidohydrolase
MIELRNDEVLGPIGVTRWAQHLAKSLTTARDSR